MRLTWSNTADIAAALAKTYPDIDRLSLFHNDLLDMISKLPEFDDCSEPPKTSYLDHILWTWMRFTDPCYDEAV